MLSRVRSVVITLETFWRHWMPCSEPQSMSIFSESLFSSLTLAQELLYMFKTVKNGLVYHNYIV